MASIRVLIISFIVCCCVSTTHAGSYAVVLQSDEFSVHESSRGLQLSIPAGLPDTLIGEPDLPWVTRFIHSSEQPAESTISWSILAADTSYVEVPLSPTKLDFPTLAEPTTEKPAPMTGATYPESVYPARNYRIEAAGISQGNNITAIRWCPFIYQPQENVLIHLRKAQLTWSDAPTDQDDSVDDLPSPIPTYPTFAHLVQCETETKYLLSKVAWTDFGCVRTGIPLDIDYVIVTSEQLLDTFYPLVLWRLKQGYRPGIAFIEEIEAAYPGEDLAAQVRAYLREAYQTGLEFCLLGGDESIVPVRYAYPAYSDTVPSPSRLQICDLYYADYDGEWDADGDGVYGEYRQDEADLFPEIAVGRLPLGTADDLATAVEKIIEYETSPGNGIPEYVSSALFTCADEMRDWNGGRGQHAAIADDFPESFVLDLASQSENPLGSAPAPTKPEGEEFIAQASDGWGWFCHINHGKADGFILRAAGLNTWPKSYVFSQGTNGDGHGHVNLLAENSSPGIILSVSCNLGGFDMDGALFSENAPLPLCESLLRHRDGGAVAMVAYSRWGWIASSYRLIERLVQYAFDDELPPHLGTAFNLAKADYPNYRDQILGLNLLGDPAMCHWRAIPKPLTINAPVSAAVNSGPVAITVSDSSGGVSAATVTILYGDTLCYQRLTNSAGQLLWDHGPDRLGGFVITATKSGYLPATHKLIAPIATGLEDEDNTVPHSFAVLQNYPNPFNAGTTIEYEVDTPGPVTTTVFDVLGRSVRTLVHQRVPAGRTSIHFDGNTDNGAPLPSGVYFYRVNTNKKSQTRKMVLMK